MTHYQAARTTRKWRCPHSMIEAVTREPGKGSTRYRIRCVNCGRKLRGSTRIFEETQRNIEHTLTAEVLHRMEAYLKHMEPSEDAELDEYTVGFFKGFNRALKLVKEVHDEKAPKK